jgi:hypothetical protein
MDTESTLREKVNLSSKHEAPKLEAKLVRLCSKLKPSNRAKTDPTHWDPPPSLHRSLSSFAVGFPPSASFAFIDDGCRSGHVLLDMRALRRSVHLGIRAHHSLASLRECGWRRGQLPAFRVPTSSAVPTTEPSTNRPFFYSQSTSTQPPRPLSCSSRWTIVPL